MVEKLKSNCIADLCYIDIEKHLKINDLVVFPIGSIEQHSKHLPLGTDYYPPLEITKRACEKSNTLYTPIMPFGYTAHHMGGAGTITLKPSSVMGVYYDVARSLIHHGYKKIIIVTGHASNLKVLDPVLRKIRYDTGAFVTVYKPWVERYIGFLEDVLEGPPEETPGWHSGESETSAMLYLKEEYVRMDRAAIEKAHKPSWLPESFMKTDGAPGISFKGYEYFNMSLEHREFSDTGTMGNPLRGTKEKGRIMIERFSDHLADAIEELKKIKVDIHHREFKERADW